MTEQERHQAEIQRVLGQLEGKVDSLLTQMQNMLAAMLRADAERDNTARDVAINERRTTEAINQLRAEFQKEHAELRSKLYWLAGIAAGGGLGVGAGGAKIIQAVFGAS